MTARSLRAGFPEALLPWLFVLGLGLRDIAVAIVSTPPDGDRYWQHWLGEQMLRTHAIPRALGNETFSAAGAPWVPQEWLMSLGLAWSGDRGVPWLVPLACGLAGLLALAAVAWRAERRDASPVAASAVVILTALSMFQSFGVRAQVFGWAALALLLCCLDARDRRVWLAVPVTVMWANVHASVLIAPALCALYAAGATLEARRVDADVRRYALASVACAAATCLTPLGLDLPRYAIGLVGSPIVQWISEWGHTSIGYPAFTFGALPLLLILAVRGGRTSVTDRLSIVAFAVLLFAAVRDVPVFAVVTAPIAASLLGLTTSAAPKRRAVRIASWLTVAATVALAFALPLLSVLRGPLPSPLPLRTTAFLTATARPGTRVFCEDFAWCSVFLGDRTVRVFMDGRCDPYPLPVWREYIAVIDGNIAWSSVLDRRHVDAVIARPAGALATLLNARPAEWVRVMSAGDASLYRRRGPQFD